MTSQQLIYSVVKTESFFFKIRNKTRMSPLTTFIQHSVGSPSREVREQKEIKGSQIEKEVKLLIFAGDILYKL